MARFKNGTTRFTPAMTSKELLSTIQQTLSVDEVFAMVPSEDGFSLKKVGIVMIDILPEGSIPSPTLPSSPPPSSPSSKPSKKPKAKRPKKAKAVALPDEEEINDEPPVALPDVAERKAIIPIEPRDGVSYFGRVKI